MSTRTVVKIKNGKQCCYLYHHYDGYFEGVGYCLAKIMCKYVQRSLEQAADYVIKMIMAGSFELTLYNHVDIEYYYEMDFTKGTVTGWKVDNWDESMKKTNKTDLIKLYLTKPEKDVEVDKELLNILEIEVHNE